MIDKIIYYLQFPFVRYALIVGILISLCSSLLGVVLVLKRFSFIGDGLSHIAFGAMAIATVLKVLTKDTVIAKWIDSSNDLIIVMPITVLFAILLLMAGQNRKIKGDASLAMLSVASLAVGYLIINLSSTSANVSGDVCSTLFGSTAILTLTKTEVWLSIIMSIVVIVMFVLFYNKIFAVTFDENFAMATGTNAKMFNLLIAVVVAIIVVLAMNLVGSLLISALIIFASILMSTPVGATIVCVNIIVFAICSVVGRIIK